MRRKRKEAPPSGALTVDRYEPAEWSIIKRACERSFAVFARTLFRATVGRQWVSAPFQTVIFNTMERVYDGEIEQLIINIPPRYGKTWTVVVLWVAWCLAKKPLARFIYTSYSDELIYTSSRFVRDIISSDVYQLMWPLSLRDDSQAKKAWTLKEHAGGLNAAPVGGQLTGFGAGVTGETGFSGARLVDDPNKVQDAGREIARDRVKDFYSGTFESRKEHRHVPTVLVQQRSDEDDLSGYLLTTGAHGTWHHLIIPGLISADDEYPQDKFPYGTPVPHDLKPGACWDYKKTVAELEAMRDNPETSFVFYSQYQQEPRAKGSTMVDRAWFKYYDTYDPINAMIDGRVRLKIKRIYIDSAQKTGEKNDFTAELCAVLGVDNNLYFVDLEHGKFDSVDLDKVTRAFCLKHRFVVHQTNLGLNAVNVEDKSSGIGLIQALNKDTSFIASIGGIKITGIPRNRDKVSRMHGVAPKIAAGRVYVPHNTPWAEKLVDEVSSFNRNMTHSHDDITDVVMDAVTELLIDDTSKTIDYGSVRAA